jgi:hypothetical protein
MGYYHIVIMKPEQDVLEEELFEAREALFMARSVKELKFLQNKINYLTKLLEKSNSGRRMR